VEQTRTLKLSRLTNLTCGWSLILIPVIAKELLIW
jgi:hypothetical protein